MPRMLRTPPLLRTLLLIAALAVLATARVQMQVASPAAVRNPNAIEPGELVIEPPTLINLGFEWFVHGDANRNASVTVTYRKRGSGAWTPALPLLRLNGERVYAESRVHVEAPNMFAGSVLDLEPGTEYEVRLVLADPDGTT